MVLVSIYCVYKAIQNRNSRGLWGPEWEVMEGQGERDVEKIATQPFYGMDYPIYSLIHTFEISTSSAKHKDVHTSKIRMRSASNLGRETKWRLVEFMLVK